MVVCYNGPARNKLTGNENNITVFLMETDRYTVWSYGEGDTEYVYSSSRMTEKELLDTWEPVSEGEDVNS